MRASSWKTYLGLTRSPSAVALDDNNNAGGGWLAGGLGECGGSGEKGKIIN